MNTATAVRSLARVSPPLTNAPGISTLTSDKTTIANDNTEVATFTVIGRDNNGDPIVGEYVTASATGSGNTLSSPAQTDSNGISTFTLKSSSAGTKVVSVKIRNIAVTQTVSLVVSAGTSPADVDHSVLTLAAASASAGDPAVLATLQAKDINGNIVTTGGETVVIGHSGGTSVVSISPSPAFDNGDGTYTAAITPTTAGTATTMTATIGGVTVTTSMPTFTVNAAASYQSADIWDNASFEDNEGAHYANGWSDSKTSGAGAIPTGGSGGNTLARDTTRAKNGTTSVKRVVPSHPAQAGNGQGPNWYYPFSYGAGSPWFMPANPGQTAGINRLFARLWFYIEPDDGVHAPNGILKFFLTSEPGFSGSTSGLYFANSKLAWVFGTEASTSHTYIAQLSSLINGWHSIEFDYWRNGDTSNGGNDYPSVALWLDDTLITSAIGTPPSPASFINGRLNAGERGRATTYKIGIITCSGVLNDTTANDYGASIWYDRISLASDATGRVGP